MAATTYDRDSGLVYQETVVAAPYIRGSGFSGPDWFFEEPFKHSRPSRVNRDRSLVGTSLRRIIDERDKLDAATIEHLPEHLIRKIWTSVRKSGFDSLRLWLIFKPLLPENRPRIRVHHQKIARGSSSSDGFLQSSAHLLNSPNCAWITVLSISDIHLLPEDGVAVSGLANLTAIHIAAYGRTRSHTGVTDRAIRNWSLQASENGSFSRLRMIFLRGCSEVTEQVFTYLCSFPLLNTLCIYKSGFQLDRLRRVQLHDWHLNRNSPFHDLLRETQSSWTLASGSSTKTKFSWHDSVFDYLSDPSTPLHERQNHPRLLFHFFANPFQNQDCFNDLDDVHYFERRRRGASEVVAGGLQSPDVVGLGSRTSEIGDAGSGSTGAVRSAKPQDGDSKSKDRRLGERGANDSGSAAGFDPEPVSEGVTGPRAGPGQGKRKREVKDSKKRVLGDGWTGWE